MVDSSNVTAGTNATALQFNNLRKDLVLAKAVAGTDADAATITVDWSDITKGKVRDITLGGNRILAFSNVTVGQFILLNIIQPPAGGPYTITYPAGIIWPYDEEYVLSEEASAIDALVFYCQSAGVYRVYPVGPDMR